MTNRIALIVALVAPLVVVIFALIAFAFQQGEIKAKVESNGDRLARIELLLDGQRSASR